MIASHQPFDFTDGDRTFTCQVEPQLALRGEPWWWFRVSTEQRQRHAPFRAVADDTPGDVQARMVAYYDELLRRRAAPPVSRWTRPVRPAPEAPVES